MSAAVREPDRIFARAVVASLLLHLSAVTVFRIVFDFPRKDTEYFNVAIVETPAISASGDSRGRPLQEQLSLSGPDFTVAAEGSPLPAIELPSLEFEQLTMLRMRQEALQTRSRFEELFSDTERGDDEWASTAGSFGALGETLSRLTFGAGESKLDAPTPISRPAPGFEAYIEWLSDPRDRKVLSVVPIDALWGLSPSALPDSIALVFRVNRDGRVVEVVNPLDDPGGLAASSAKALRRYRFEPLLGEGPPTQGGTLIVRAEAEGP